MQFMRQNQEMQRDCEKWYNYPGLEYLLTGAKSWSTTCTTDVKQSSETVVMQLNISLLFSGKFFQSSSISLYIQYFFEFVQKYVNAAIFFNIFVDFL